MGIRKSAAQAVSAASTAVLRNIFRRPAGNFPGKIALYLDPQIIASMTPKLARGSVCVVGTNGKTTVTNMLADCLQAAGQRVVCNRTGANLDSGVATSLLNASDSDWGVFECDELWLAKILPQLQSNYVVLLNLFRDQLDRVVEVDRIQDSIVSALQASPNTVLIYNADDPFCERIARLAGNPAVPFGIGERLEAGERGSSDARMCQFCDGMLEYEYRSYNQLGRFSCKECDFHRAPLRFSARNCAIGDGLAFDVVAAVDEKAVGGGAIAHIAAPYSGVYMIYNLLALYAAANLTGVANDVIQGVVASFDPQNGRLQELDVQGKRVLLNLAKNPTGFNQNIDIIVGDPAPKAVALFVNDYEGDGRDVSWLWDVDFERLAACENTAVFVGGLRRNSVQLRLKYAGIDAVLVDDAPDCMARAAGLPADTHVYMIANYTALPGVRESMEQLAGSQPVMAPPLRSATPGSANQFVDAGGLIPNERPLRIVQVLPDLLNLYGDAGNVSVLAKRCEWRGIPVTVASVEYGQSLDLSQADIVFIGGGPKREQRLASHYLQDAREQFATYVQDGGVVLAVCGGYQIVSTAWYLGDEKVPGLGLVDVQPGPPAGDNERLVGDIVIESPIAASPVVGYENHAARSLLGDGVQPFGTIKGSCGHGNTDEGVNDGVIAGNLVATYAHGPVLAKNPEVADWIIRRAIERRTGEPCKLPALDDAVEKAANNFMCERLGVL